MSQIQRNYCAQRLCLVPISSPSCFAQDQSTCETLAQSSSFELRQLRIRVHNLQLFPRASVGRHSWGHLSLNAFHHGWVERNQPF